MSQNELGMYVLHLFLLFHITSAIVYNKYQEHHVSEFLSLSLV